MLSEKMEAAFNKQITAELYASNLYLAMGAYFDAQAYRGFGHWLRLQSEEERQHAIRIIDIVVDRGGDVKIQAIEAPSSFESPLAVFEQVLAQEERVTRMFHVLSDLAEQERDHTTLDRSCPSTRAPSAAAPSPMPPWRCPPPRRTPDRHGGSLPQPPLRRPRRRLGRGAGGRRSLRGPRARRLRGLPRLPAGVLRQPGADPAPRCRSGDGLPRRTPFVRRTKTEVVALGIGLGVPWELTHTCYTGRRPACGLCDACSERLAAFAANGAADPLPYERRETGR